MIPSQFIRFIVASGLAAIANFGSRIILGHVMSYVSSIVVAYLIGMATAFVLNRLFVFHGSDRKLHSQATWFVLVNVLAVIQTVVFSLLFARMIFPVLGMGYHPETIAHAIGVIVPVFSSYAGHKHLTFRVSRGRSS